MGKKGQQKQRQYLGVTTRESENILDNNTTMTFIDWDNCVRTYKRMSLFLQGIHLCI